MQEKIIRLTEVTIDNSLNPRQGALDQEAVLEYSQHIADLPPMQAFDIPGEGLVLVAGFHRYAAHQLAGDAKGCFIIHQGDRARAAEFADLDNLRHGLRLTRTEKRAVIGRYLRRHPERSDVWVAKDCYTTDKTVRSVREELEAAGEIEVLHKLTGMDGVERPRSIEQPKRSAEVDSSQQPLVLDDPNEEMTEEQKKALVTWYEDQVEQPQTQPAAAVPADPPPESQWLDPAPPAPPPHPPAPAPLPPPPAKAAAPKPAASYRLSILIKAGAPAVVDVWQMNGDNRAISHQEVEDWGTLPGVVGQLVSELEV